MKWEERTWDGPGEGESRFTKFFVYFIRLIGGKCFAIAEPDGDVGAIVRFAAFTPYICILVSRHGDKLIGFSFFRRRAMSIVGSRVILEAMWHTMFLRPKA